MFRIATMITTMLGLGIGASAAVPGQDSGDKTDGHVGKPVARPLCPVMNEPVNFLISEQTKDGPVYFCCKGCVGKYQADRAKYAAKVARQREAVSKRPKVQVTCPVSGKAVDGKTSLQHKGHKAFFHSDHCAEAFKKNPGKYEAALASSYTYQTKCPVMGGDVNPECFTTLAGGQKIYFCCQGCESALYKDPAKYAPKLAEQGYGYKPEQIRPAAQGNDADKGQSHAPGRHGHGGHDHSGH